MKKIILLSGLILFSGILSFSQTKVFLDTTFSVSQTSDEGTVYLYNYAASLYKSVFIKELKEAFHVRNLELVTNISDTTGFYSLNIAKFFLKEAIRTETVDDTASEQNGQSYQLSYCEVKSEYVISTSGHQTIGSGKASTMREESISNSRSFFDWLFGLNKDHTEYHEKTLPQNIFLSEIQQVASRIAKKTAKKIEKAR